MHTYIREVAVCRGEALRLGVVAQGDFLLKIKQRLGQFFHIKIRLAEPEDCIGEVAGLAAATLDALALLERLYRLFVFFEGDQYLAITLQHIRKVVEILALAVDFYRLFKEFLTLEKLFALVICAGEVVERVVEDFGFVDSAGDFHGAFQILLRLFEVVEVEFAAALVGERKCQ